MSFFRMSQSSIFLAQMGGNIVGEGVESINLLDQHVQPIVKFGGGSIMVWRCMNWEGVGNLRLIEGIMDKYVYCEILEMELISTIHMHDLKEENVIFQHNNNPKHSSKYIKDWLLA
jgi:hypothetical protein